MGAGVCVKQHFWFLLIRICHLISQPKHHNWTHWRAQKKMHCAHAHAENPFQQCLVPSHPFRLEWWIQDHFKSSAFNTCPHHPLGYDRKAIGHYLHPDVMLSVVYTPITVPHHWKKRVKQDLDQNIVLGIIEWVPTGTPTTWYSRMVITSKTDSFPRCTVDLQELNAASMREIHHTHSLFNQVSIVPVQTKKTDLDAMKRVWQLTAFPGHTRYHYIYHWIGLVQICSCSPGISHAWRWLYLSVQWYYSGHGLKNLLHRQ